ncbi:MAG: hypothetical protein LPK48_12155, partial [Bacteroidota bacterium]|nr:hypothetical protein [Bacteroidota bacterium]
GDSTADSVYVLWAGPGTGVLTITQISPFGCDSTISENVTIVQTPKPIITLPNDSACQNKIYTYSVTPVAGETYAWTVSGGQIISDTSANSIEVLWGAPGIGTIHLTQTSIYGCDSMVSANVNIVYTPSPDIVFPNDTACENKIYSYHVPSDGPNESYQWSVIGGQIIGSSTDSMVNVLWGGPGTGYIEVVQTSAFGCDSTWLDSVTIVHTPKPIMVLPNDTACENKIERYTVNFVAGETYSWNVTGGQIIGANNDTAVSILWGSTGTGTVSLTQTSIYGCDSTIRSNVAIMPTPTPVITGDDSVCQNKIYNYSITAATGHTYVWSANGGSIVGANNQSSVNVMWGTPGVGTVSVTQFSEYGCDSSVTYAVEIFRTPMPVIAGEDTVCQDKVHTYHVDSVTLDAYNWSVVGGSIIGNATDTFVIIKWGTNGAGSVILQQTSSLGCDSIVSLSVLIQPTPQPIMQGDTNPCQDKVYTYQVQPQPNHRYQWSIQGGHFLSDTTLESINVVWDSTDWGTITLTMISPEGCDSTITDSVFVRPTPRATISGGDTSCQNDIVVYRVPSDPTWTYNWSVTGGQIIGSQNVDSVSVLWTNAGTGNVAINIFNTAGCDTLIYNYPVVVKDKPTPVINGQGPVCRYKTYQYSTDPIPGDSYTWEVVGGYMVSDSTQAAVMVLWDSASVNIIRLNIMNSQGCDSTVERIINVLPTPVPVISCPAAPCENDLTGFSTFLGNSSQVGGTLSYKWTVTNGAVLGADDQQNVQIQWAGDGISVVRLTVTTAGGCDSTVEFTANVQPA